MRSCPACKSASVERVMLRSLPGDPSGIAEAVVVDGAAELQGAQEEARRVCLELLRRRRNRIGVFLVLTVACLCIGITLLALQLSHWGLVGASLGSGVVCAWVAFRVALRTPQVEPVSRALVADGCACLGCGLQWRDSGDGLPFASVSTGLSEAVN